MTTTQLSPTPKASALSSSHKSSKQDSFIIESIKPMEWYTLRYWARETAIYDQRKYRKKQRPITLNRIARLFSPNLKKPVFIIGAPRSGTTFLGTCIGELPEISYHFEPIAIKAATSYVHTQQWSLARMKSFYPKVYGWLMRMHGDADLRLADKTPRNSLIVPQLHQVFPDAQFVFIQRDGRDAALSLSKKPWYQNETKGKGLKEPSGFVFGPDARFWVEPDRAEEFETTSNVHRCVWIWRQYVENVLTAKDNIPDSQFYEMRYEDLVTAPREEASNLLNFLGIENPESREIFVDYVVQNASPGSVGNWKKALSAEQLEQVDAEAGELLAALGY